MFDTLFLLALGTLALVLLAAVALTGATAPSATCAVAMPRRDAASPSARWCSATDAASG